MSFPVMFSHSSCFVIDVSGGSHSLLHCDITLPTAFISSLMYFRSRIPQIISCALPYLLLVVGCPSDRCVAGQLLLCSTSLF